MMSKQLLAILLLGLTILFAVLQYYFFGFHAIPWEHRLISISAMTYGAWLGLRLGSALEKKAASDANT